MVPINKKVRGAPVHKLSSAGLGGAAAAVTVWAMEEFGHVPVPDHVAIAIGSLLTAVISWGIPDRLEA